MPNKKLNAKLLWMQFEDVLAPRLGLTVWDRAVYSHLLRHSLVVGKFRLQFGVRSLARTPAHVHGLDHVVPRVRFGRNSYRNLVSSCMECNTRKGDRPAPDFLRTLYRQGRLTPAELDARLRALKDLAAGKLRPSL
jgi:hypothetical protein